MKFVVRVLYKKLQGRRECRDDWHSERHILLQGMNEIFCIFDMTWMQISLTKAVVYISACVDIYLYFPHLSSSLCEIQY